ncbi:MAG: hypothetical protein P0Y66_10105 [Candidatus Kaistia colombiensis]|nr:MAG: hypothetical protein P0Y66_10105 [Kaistia sp.]
MNYMPPDPGSAFNLDSVAAAEVRAALRKILQSDEFVASPQLCAFLTYIVEAHLAGNEHKLKGQTIGTVVLGRPEGYDSQRDPIVRVEANRLRRTLAAYYEHGGAEDPVRVVVERGSYVPRFERIVPEPPPLPQAAMPQPTPAQPDSGGSWPGAILIGVVLASIAIALLGVFLFLKPATGIAPAKVQSADAAAGSNRAATPHAATPYLPSVAVLPFAAPGPGAAAERGEELVSGLTVALARFPELRVLASGDQPADFRVEGDIAVSDRKSTVSMRLSSARTAEVLWSASIDMPVAELVTRPGIDRILAIATTAIAPQFGAIAQHVSRGAAGPAGEMSGYDCLIEAQLHGHRLDDANWRRVDGCLGDIIERYPSFGTAWASRALLLMERYRLNPDRAGALESQKEAEDLARHALQLEPTNVRAMTAVATVAFSRGDLEAARNIGLRAITANPYDPLSRSQYVLALIASDYPDQALQQAAAARLLDPAHVSFYDSLDLLARIGKPVKTEPVSGAVIADVSLLPYGAVARVLAYDATGPIAARDTAVKALYELMPLFATDMPAALRRQFPPSPYTRRLQEALSRAGVGS